MTFGLNCFILSIREWNYSKISLIYNVVDETEYIWVCGTFFKSIKLIIQMFLEKTYCIIFCHDKKILKNEEDHYWYVNILFSKGTQKKKIEVEI